MRRFLCTVLAIIMVFSLCTVAQAYDNITTPVEQVSVVVKGSAFTNAYQLDSRMVVAQYIKYDRPIKGVMVLTDAFGDAKGDNVTLSIVPWRGNYGSSLYEKPLGKKSFKNVANASKLSVMIEDPDNYRNELMLVISDASDTKIGLWNGTLNPDVEQKTFVNGQETTRNVTSWIITDAQSTVSENVHTEPRNAYEPIIAADYDYSYGMLKQTNADSGFDGDEMVVTNGLGGDPNTKGFRGVYAGYAKIDFGKVSPKAVTFRYKMYPQSAHNRTEIQVYLDKPDGKKIAETLLWLTPDVENNFGELDLQITEKVTGVHDVYVTFGYSPVFFSTFQFSAEEKPLNKFDNEIKSFKPVEESELMYTYSDTWSATDMLGRKLPGYETVGERDPEKQVIMFYWTRFHQPGVRALNVNEKSRLFPEEKNNYDSPIWESGRYFYNESIYGYASSYDEWMLRKQFELFAAAGVDALAFDSSNTANSSAPVAMRMRKLLHEMMQEGYKVPKLTHILCFSIPDWATNTIEELYQTLYKPGIYSDTWYYWDGKPLLVGHQHKVGEKSQGEEMLEFFNFRQCQTLYVDGQTADNQWPWLEVYPQHGFGPLENSKYNYEMCAVSIAQNRCDEGTTAMNHGDDIYGRSYSYKDRFKHLKEEYSELYGYNFQEQWDRAFELNTKGVFITGWNEYSAGRNQSWGKPPTPNGFPDQFDDEYSRDIEPIKGVLQDVYYYQLVANIRKFKGVEPTPVASGEKTININGDFAQWQDVGPDFHGFKGGVEPRNEVNLDITYTNETGRNDIVLSKVARDKDNLYFYVETVENLTPHTDKNWMRLFINTDRQTTGWEGYDYVINRVSPTSAKAVVEKNTGNWNWEKAAEVDYKVQGNKMMIAVPRDILGVTGAVDIEFKWNDNMQTEGNIMDFYVNGDTAPIGRFAYRYTESTENDKEINYKMPEGASYEPSPYAKLVYNTVMALDNNISIDRGEKVHIDPANPDVTPKIINDKTMVPLRFLCESMEAKVTWNDETQSATIVYMGKRIRVTPGSNNIRVEKDNILVQTPPQEIDGRIYIPLRDIVEAMGTECYWVDPGLIIIGTDSEKIYTKNEDVRDMIKFWYGI